MKHMVKFTALVCCSLAAASLFAADPATGWKQTGGGTYDYNDTANWVGGDINGVFSSDLELTAAQTITFAADTSLADGLTINYKGNFPMTFQSDGSGAKTLTLGGDISEALQGNASAVVTIGGADDNALILDLDGKNRTITAAATVGDIGKSGILSIPAKIQNGALTINGAKKLKLAGANIYAGGTTIAGSTYVYVNSETAFGTGDVSINGALNLCADNNLTMTKNNKFYVNAAEFYYHSGKALDIGTGDVVATNSFKFWAEGDSLTIHGKIVDKDGVPSPWKLKKWGSKKLYTYSDAVMSDGGKFEIGNGEWYFNGAISGTGFTVDASSATSGTQHFRLQSANTFQGTLSITGGSLYVYAGNEYAIPNGSKVSIGAGTYFIGNGKSNYISSLMANNGVTTDSNGTLCFNSSDSGDIDLTDYPDLVLGSRGGARTYSGTITWPDINPLRLGGGGDSFTFSLGNAIPTGRDFEILGKVRFTAASDADGVVTVRNEGLLLLEEGNGALPDAKIVVEQGGELRLSSTVACDIVRAADVTLKAGLLNFNGHKSYAVKHKITKLTLMTMPGAGGTPQLTWSTGNSKQTTLEIGSVERPDHCFLNVSGGNPGLTNFESGWNVVIKSGVENTAEGTVGTTTAPFVPWIRNGLTNLVYNDPDKGLRFHASEERQVYSSAYSDVGPVNSGENMLINYSGDVVFTGANATVATFSFNNKENQYFKMPDGVLKVTSGAIGCTYTKVHPQVTVDLCSQHGYIIGAYNRAPYLEGSIGGTDKGLTIANDAAARGNPIEVWASGTYSGDVHIHGAVWIRNATFLPGGLERPGNIYLDGFWRCGDCSVQVNGIYGAGLIKIENGFNNAVINMGVDGHDGDFDGEVQRTNGTLKFVKIGAGRQRFGGECTHNGATTVSAGTLQVDGAFTQSEVTVAEGATLAGCGTFGGAVTLADGAKLEAGSKKVEDQVMNLDGGLTLEGDATLDLVFKDNLTVGGITLGGAPTLPEGKKITVNVVLGAGEKLKSKQHVIVESTEELNIANFKRGENCGNLKLSADRKQLLMTVQSGLALYLR